MSIFGVMNIGKEGLLANQRAINTVANNIANVNTPSYTGVSRPVYRSATARWRNYREQIEVVRDTLDPFVEAFGYAGETDRTAAG